MEAKKQYITEITSKDLEEIAAMANAYPGDGIELMRNPDGMEISIDRGQLTRWVKTIMAGGNI